MPKKLSERTKKNLLDLQYNKFLQYYNTSIIILFTYLIALAIGFVTKQINYRDTGQLTLVVPISIGIITILTLSMLRFKDHLKNILEEVKKLRMR